MTWKTKENLGLHVCKTYTKVHVWVAAFHKFSLTQTQLDQYLQELGTNTRQEAIILSLIGWVKFEWEENYLGKTWLRKNECCVWTSGAICWWEVEKALVVELLRFIQRILGAFESDSNIFKLFEFFRYKSTRGWRFFKQEWKWLELVSVQRNRRGIDRVMSAKGWLVTINKNPRQPRCRRRFKWCNCVWCMKQCVTRYLFE